MGVPLLPHELDGAELVVELAWGAGAFGADPTDPRPTWTDVTDRIRHDETVQINRGRADEADTTQPAECTVKFDNTDGAFSLAGDSPNWPNVRRGVPCRVRVPGLVDGLYLPGRDQRENFALGGGIDEPAPWTPTGEDIDVRVLLEPDTWRPTGRYIVAGQWIGGSGDNMWIMRIHPDGWPEIKWSPDGSDANAIVNVAGAIPVDAGRLALRVTIDVDNGNGERVITWYTGDSIDGPWSEHWRNVDAGTTTLHASSHFVAVGAQSDGTLEFAGDAPYRGMVHDLQVRDGIDGPIGVHAGFDQADPWPGGFLGPDGNQWGAYGGELVGGVLFVGFANGFTPSWSLSGDPTVSMTASGTLRRIEGRRKPLASAMSRSIPGQFSVVAYWPMEEGERAGAFTSGLANSTATLTPRGDVSYADDDGFPGSDSIPTISAGSIDGNVPSYELQDGATRITFLLAVPEDGMDDTEDSLLVRVRLSGAGYARWDVHVRPDGGLNVRVYDQFGDEDPGEEWNVNSSLLGFRGLFSVLMSQNVMAVNMQLAWIELGATSAVASSKDYPNSTMNVVQWVQLGDRRHSNGASFGQLAIYSGAGHTEFWETAGTLMTGYAGETALDRMHRLALENDVYLYSVGESDVPMGPQPIDTLMNAMRECELADQGVLLDGTGPGLRYITRTMRQSVEPTVVLDAANGDVADPFEPVHDDEGIVNRFTASQVDGSEVTVEQRTGPVGTAAIDVYEEDRDLNVNAVGPLRDYAAWRVHLGTNPGYRYPSAAANVRASPHLAPQWLRAYPSSRLDVTNGRAAFPHIPDGTRHLLVEGTETNIAPYTWTVVAQCSNYDPWRVGIAANNDGGGAGDYATPADTVESYTAAPAASSSTTVDVATVYGPYWGDMDAPYPLNVGGHVVDAHTVAEDVYRDTFARTVSSGWGTADSGQGYAYFAPGGSSDFSVADPDGVVTLTTADASVVARVVDTPREHVDHSATVVVPTDAVGIWHGLASGYVDDVNYVFAILRYDAATGIVLQLSSFVDGTGATYGDRVVFGSYSGGMEIRVRLRKAAGSYLARAWRVGDPEPTSWHVGATVPELAGAAEYGTYGAALSGGPTLPVDIAYRDMRMHNPQRITTDPLPGDVATGAPVRVDNPPIAGL